MLKSNILNNLKTRGFINDCTDLMGLDNLLSTSKLTCYIGYDATASSLHVGHLMNIMMLRWVQTDGHRVITLLGGGTTKIGDPSFRKTERPLIDDKIINTEPFHADPAPPNISQLVPNAVHHSKRVDQP